MSHWRNSIAAVMTGWISVEIKRSQFWEAIGVNSELRKTCYREEILELAEALGLGEK